MQDVEMIWTSGENPKCSKMATDLATFPWEVPLKSQSGKWEERNCVETIGSCFRVEIHMTPTFESNKEDSLPLTMVELIQLVPGISTRRQTMGRVKPS